MKFLINRLIWGAYLFAVIGTATSCTNKDLFDQDAWNAEMKSTFPVSNIATDWQSVGSATASVSVNKDAGSSYIVKLYDSDPLAGSATLLAKGTVATGSTFNTTFDYALADSTIYVACVDANNRREVIPIHHITRGSSFNVTFGNTTSSKAVSRAVTSRTSVTITDPDVATIVATPSESYINDMIAKATDISQVPNNDIANNGTNAYNYYKITGNYSGNFIAGSPKVGTKVIVTGTWTPSSGMQIQDPIEIIVAKGGQIILNSTLTSMTGKTNGAYAFTVMPGGQISGTQLYNTNGGSVFNAGTISIGYMNWASSGGRIFNAATGSITTTSSDDYNGGLNLNSTTNFVNYGTLNVASRINAPATGYIINGSSGTMYAKSINLNTGATLINHSPNCRFGNDVSSNDNANYATDCKLTFDGTFNPKTLILGDNASVECSTLNMHNSTVTMGEASILKAATSNYGPATMNGPTSGNAAIFVAGNVNNSEWGTVVFNNKLYVDVTSHPSSIYSWDWYNTRITYNNSASAVGNGEAPETIPAGDCTIGYISKNGPAVVDNNFCTTYCFEDNYPNAGDYDFNDVVFDVTRTINSNVVTLAVKLRAVGASKQLGGGIRLSGITSGITSVALDNGFGNASTGYQQGLNSSGIVIPLFTDAHKVLTGSTNRVFVNTKKSGTDVVNVDPKTLTITITCGSADVANKITSATVDPYITNGSYEVHTYSWINSAALGKVADKVETGKYVWAIGVPKSAITGIFKYPLEYVPITDVYSKFASWAQHADNTVWYDTFDSSKLY